MKYNRMQKYSFPSEMRNFAPMNGEQPSPTLSRAVTVYCASSPDAPAAMMQAAYRLGQEAARRSITTITGAGATGLMSAVIDGTLDGGGRSIGVIPEFMTERGWANRRLSDVRITPDMHTRKQLLASLGDGAIALPGGPGTIEELMELMTWRQLGIHTGSLVICNTDGYYDQLLGQLEAAARCNLMRPTGLTGAALYTVARTPEESLDIIFPSDNA